MKSENTQAAPRCTEQRVVMRATLPLTCATCDYDLYSVRIKYGVSAITKCQRCGELNRLIVGGYNHPPHNAPGQPRLAQTNKEDDHV